MLNGIRMTVRSTIGKNYVPRLTFEQFKKTTSVCCFEFNFFKYYCAIFSVLQFFKSMIVYEF